MRYAQQSVQVYRLARDLLCAASIFPSGKLWWHPYRGHLLRSGSASASMGVVTKSNVQAHSVSLSWSMLKKMGIFSITTCSN